jgi:hypothetical protein
MKRRQQKSLIPEKYQLPIAIGGAVLLVLIVFLNYVLPGLRGGGEGAGTTEAVASAVAPAPSAPANAAAAAVPATPELADLQVLESLLAELQKQLVEVPEQPAAPPPVTSNPFSPFATGPMLDPGNSEFQGFPGEVAPGATLEGTGFNFPLPELPEEPSEEELERRDRLSRLVLSGTMTSGEVAIAVINGGYYRLGDQVEGFRLSAIQEKQVTLQDELGTEVLHLRDPNRSGSPGLTLPPALKAVVEAPEEAVEMQEVAVEPEVIAPASAEAAVTTPGEEP